MTIVIQKRKRLVRERIGSWLQPASEEQKRARSRCKKNFCQHYGPLRGRAALILYEAMNDWRLLRGKEPGYVAPLLPRERRLSALLLAAGLTASTCFALVGNTRLSGATFVHETPALFGGFGTSSTAQPVDWLDGSVSLKGSKEAVAGAYNYAVAAGYPFAANKTERDQLVGNGTLVKLEGKYLELDGVSNPYVLPATATFVNRLSAQYAWQGCGKLQVTGAMRPLDLQETLSNGSDHSVHLTGMAVDLRRTADEEDVCLQWLQDRLEAVEPDRRIDATAENFHRHFHVVVLPREYEEWLQSQPPQVDPEKEALAKALYFEGGFNESLDGYKAIAAVIKNRARSKGFPHTILEVVAQGAAGKHAGSCQFSFVCDGRVEYPETLCGEHPENAEFWNEVCETRWKALLSLAQTLITSTDDPTGGAVLYYTGPKPYWAQERVELRKDGKGNMVKIERKDGDFKPGTIRKIGSHTFGCAVYRGSDVCDKKKGDRT